MRTSAAFAIIAPVGRVALDPGCSAPIAAIGLDRPSVGVDIGEPREPESDDVFELELDDVLPTRCTRPVPSATDGLATGIDHALPAASTIGRAKSNRMTASQACWTPYAPSPLERLKAAIRSYGWRGSLRRIALSALQATVLIGPGIFGGGKR